MADQLEPFVGPRPFEREDQKYFFGRDQAASELVSLILSYPTVILYAQSGAGKTSLLKAKVLSVLEDKKGFDVPPIARVRGGTDVSDTEIANVYVANALRDLSDNTLPAERRARMTLAEYLAERPRPPRPPSELDEEEEDQEGQVRRASNRPRVLIFDQFEELFTLYPERYNDRKNFFEQLREALDQDSLLRVVFSMREDYIAELDPYVHILPDSLRTRFRLERLRKQPAVQAVLGPVSRFNEQVPPDKHIQISKDQAETLIDNLRTIKVHSGAGEVEFEGEFVEPVHLQIVCKALLEKMVAEGKPVITEGELKEFGNVNQALAEYFERAIAKASQQGGVDEGKLRRWFNDVLITPDNTRSTVLRGKMQTAGISNEAIDVLAAERLIRSETRDNREWYELSHDKLIEPIRLSFQQWLLKQGGDEQMRLSFIARAEKWLASHRTDNSLLLAAAEIENAKRWTSHEADGYNESLAALVDASQAALDRVERERERVLARQRQHIAQAEAEFAKEKAAAAEREAQQAQIFAAKQARSARALRFMVVGLGLMVLLSVGASVFAFRQGTAATRARVLAESRRILAEQREEEATAARKFAEEKSGFASEQQQEAEKQRELAEKAAKQADAEAKLARAAEEKAAAAAHAERKLSEEVKLQKTIAISSTAAARAELMIAQQPSQLDSSVKRALASLTLNPNSIEGEQALRHGLALLPLLAKKIDFPAQQVAFTPKGDVSVFNSHETRLYSMEGEQKHSVTTYNPEGYAISSDDGRYVATINGNGEARITNLTDLTGKTEIISLRKPGENTIDLWHATFSPDGIYLACFVSNRLRVWEVKTKRLAMDIEAVPLNPEELRTALTFSPDGAFIGVADKESVSVYKVESEKVESREKVFTAPQPRFARATFTIGTKYLALGTDEDVKGELVRVVDLRDNNNPAREWLTSRLVESCVFSPDEKKLATTIGNQVTIWDSESGREITRVGHSVGVKNVVFSTDGGLLATTGEDRTTRLWDLRTGRELLRMGHNDDVVSVSFSRDRKFLVTGSKDVRVWDITRAGIGLDLYQDETLDQIILSHKGAYLAVVTIEAGNTHLPIAARRKDIKIFDTITGRELVKLENRQVLKVAFSADDEFLLVADVRNIEALRVRDGQVANEYKFGGLISSIEFSANGRYAVASVLEKGVRLLDLSGKEPAVDLPFTEPVNTQGTGKVAISRNGERVFLQDRAGTYSGWDNRSGSVFRIGKGVRTTAASSNMITSPDGRYFAFQPRSITWEIYDVVQSKSIFNEQTESNLRTVSFSNDGKLVAFAYRDEKLIQVYNLATQARVAEFTSESPTTHISFSDDQKYVASGGGGLVQVWSVETSNEVARTEYGGSLRTLDFSSDGKYVMTGSTDRNVRLILLRTRDLMDIACSRTSGLSVEEWAKLLGDEPYRPICDSSK